MIIKAEQFLKSRIKEYYEKNFISVPNIEKREFGYGIYNKKILDRNIAFKNDYELNTFLRERVPFYLSYSVAYYELPDAKPTSAKKLLKNDFIFEYDADDIPTPCKKTHDSWICPKCKEEGKGHTQKCPKCNSRTEISEWICDKCLDATKKQTKRLYNILTYELGFSEQEIKITFSGHKGFHTKIISPKIENIKQNERIELMDYITEEGLNFKELGFVPDEKGSIKFLGEKLGKSQKYLNFIKTVLESNDATELLKYFDPNTSTQTLNKLVNNKKEALESLEKGKFYRPRKESVDLWYNLLENLKESQKLYVDRQTTIDMYKIIRVPNTIHGGAMLLSKEVKIDKISDFNPFEEASIYKDGTLKIHLKKVPRLLLNREIFGPYENEIVELPNNIATYFLAKGVADEAIL
ncbi:MAG: hypothetical protein COT14_03295 [Candidatus Diapherotrites archaeon CG08_land_8_20_14_0_20_30_16]|nr:MAG: hypothetical protein COT14_03295 [Candidatus Diapherotrites archaeon CG08_land_8_20_14_0_20_30_16]